MNRRQPKECSEPTYNSHPHSVSEPPPRRHPPSGSEPRLIRHPDVVSESENDSHPCHSSEPLDNSHPWYSSEPPPVRHPGNRSEPYINRHPRLTSEPLWSRHPRWPSDSVTITTEGAGQGARLVARWACMNTEETTIMTRDRAIIITRNWASFGRLERRAAANTLLDTLGPVEPADKVLAQQVLDRLNNTAKLAREAFGPQRAA